MDCDMDMVMVGSTNSLSASLVTSMDMCNIDSENSEDGIAVLYKSKEVPHYYTDDDKLTSLSVVCSVEGPPLEQREDIVQTKTIPNKLKEVLNFNDDQKLRDVEGQMKARENIDKDMELEILNIANMEESHMLEDVTLREAAHIARDKAIHVRHVAKEGKTTLKRAMEIMEVALPPFLSACEKSYEQNDLSEEVDKESMLVEQCLLEKKRAGLNFELGQQKAQEADVHLDKCIERAKEDEIKIAEKYKSEVESGRLKNFQEASNEMNDIVKSELDEVKKNLEYCKKDLVTIDTITEDQHKRFHLATRSHEMADKTMDTKINVNRKNQDELRSQLANLEEQERKLVERRTFERQVQDRSKEWNAKVCEQLADLKSSIENVQSCATTSLEVMELMKVGGNNLLSAAIQAEKQYLEHLKDLDKEAKHKFRNALAHSAVERKISVGIATSNIDEYKEKYKCMKSKLNKAIQNQRRLDIERLQNETTTYRDEMKVEEKKKKKAEQELDILMEKINTCDEQLRLLGRHVETVETLYQQKQREFEDDVENNLGSLGYSSQEEGSDDEN